MLSNHGKAGRRGGEEKGTGMDKQSTKICIPEQKELGIGSSDFISYSYEKCLHTTVFPRLIDPVFGFLKRAGPPVSYLGMVHYLSTVHYIFIGTSLEMVDF